MNGGKGLLLAGLVLLLAGGVALLALIDRSDPGPEWLEMEMAEQAASSKPLPESTALAERGGASAQAEPTSTGRDVAPPSGGAAYVTLRAFFVGQPAESALVFATDAESRTKKIGWTDAAGVLVFDLDPGYWTLTIQKVEAAYWSQAFLIRGGEAREVVVQLPRHAPIEGIARHVDGQPAAPGTVVWAWEAELADVGDAFQATRGGQQDARLFKAGTGTNGLFRIEGPEPGKSYRMAAVGPQGMSDQGLVVRAGSRAELTLRPAYARVVTFRDVAGGALPGPELRRPGDQPEIQLDANAKRFGIDTNPELWLTPLGGLLAAQPTNPGPLKNLLVGAYAPHGLATPPDSLIARMMVQHPDFQSHRATLELGLVGGRPQWTEVVLQEEEGAPKGTLTIDARFAKSVAAAVRNDPRQLGSLQLENAAGEARNLLLGPAAELPLRGIPLEPGTWSVRFVTRDGGFGQGGKGLALRSVVVTAGQETQLTLDLRALSAAELTLVGEDGPWAGGAILLVEGRDRSRRFLTLARAPYVILGLQADEYDVSVNRLMGSHLRGSAKGTITGAGELLEVEVPLAKGRPR